MRSTIRFKIILISILAILIGIVSVFLASYATVSTEIDHRSVETMNLISEDARHLLEKYLKGIEQSVEMVSNIAVERLDSVVLIENGAVGTGDKVKTARQTAVLDAYLSGYCKSVQEVMTSVASHTPGIASYFFCISPEISVSEHGFFYSRIGKTGFVERDPIDARGLDPEDIEHTTWYYTTIRRGRPSWVGPYTAHFLEEMWTCSFLVPIYRSGTLIGIMGMDIPLETMIEQINSIGVYNTGFVALLDEEGKVFYHPEFDIGVVPELSGISLSDDIFDNYSNGDEMIRYYSGSEQRQMSFTTLSNGMKLFAIAPVKEINSSWARTVSIIVPATAVIIAIVVVILMFVIRAITQPLHTLTSASGRLAAGDYDVELDYRHRDEIGELTDAFNSMRDKLKLNIEDLNRKANTDALTGLPNVRYFFELAEAERKSIRESGGTPVFMYFNIIGIRYYNRQFGFDEGDKLICKVGDILTGHYGIRSISRLSQDHFGVITSEEHPEYELEKIFEECRKADEKQTLYIRVGLFRDELDEVSVGVAMDRAKYACDQRKGSFVSGYYYFDDGMLSEIEEVRHIINNLDRALEEHWIQAYYQPIVRADDGELCDEETLARWLDPVKGMISPGVFIPILEKARLAYKLDLYMLDRIIEKINTLKKRGQRIVPQSLNLSRADFDSCDIVDEICRRLEAAGVEREYLTVEITESMVGSDFDFMKEQIERFQTLGFKVWMDDFGSGYSALDVLQDIHFDVIKFDMRFMKRIGEEEEESKIILKELLHMTDELCIDTVCEGVETEEQVDFLRKAGCTSLQGYYFSKPKPFV